MVTHLSVAGLAKSTALNYVRALRDMQEHTGKPADKLSRDELLAYLAARRECSRRTEAIAYAPC